MGDELSPCPFCGSEQIYQEHTNIQCPDCGCMGPDKHVAGECGDPYVIWNKRWNPETEQYRNVLADLAAFIDCDANVKHRAIRIWMRRIYSKRTSQNFSMKLNWISIKDKKPEPDQTVICYFGDGTVSAGYEELKAHIPDNIQTWVTACCRGYYAYCYVPNELLKESNEVVVRYVFAKHQERERRNAENDK